jgi:hypothetical protein
MVTVVGLPDVSNFAPRVGTACKMHNVREQKKKTPRQTSKQILVLDCNQDFETSV